MATINNFSKEILFTISTGIAPIKRDGTKKVKINKVKIKEIFQNINILKIKINRIKINKIKQKNIIEQKFTELQKNQDFFNRDYLLCWMTQFGNMIT